LVALQGRDDKDHQEWCDALGMLVQRTLKWDAVESQTLWLLLTAELTAKSTRQLEMGLSKVVSVLDAHFQVHPQSCHWEVCV
jgi:hypothetical protein